VVLDISTPASPAFVGSVDTPGEARKVLVQDDYAYVSDAYFGLQVVDVSNAAAPAIVGAIDTIFVASASFSGSSLLLATETPGLQIADPSDPAHPVLLKTFPTPNAMAEDIAIQGTTAYVADQSHGLQVLDISDPSEPQWMANIVPGLDSIPYDIAIAGDYAYIADYGYGLRIVDISNPLSPVLVGSLPHQGGEMFSFGVAVAGNYAYVASRETFSVIDLSNPAAPSLAGSITAPGQMFAYDVQVLGDYAYIADQQAGLRIINVSNPAQPVFAGALTSWMGAAYDLAVLGTHVYLATSLGLFAVDVSQPASPAVVGSYQDNVTAWGVALMDHYAVVAEDRGAAVVVDIADPTHLRLASRYGLVGQVHSVATTPDHAYLLSRANGLMVLKVKDVHTISEDTDLALHPAGEAALVKILTLPEHGSVYLGGVPVAVNQEITREQLAAGLIYRPEAEYSGPDVFTWTTSEGGAFNPQPTSVEVVVQPVNDSPANLGLSNDTVAEGRRAGTVVGGFSATDVDSETITFSLVAGIGSADNAAFQIVGNELRTRYPLDYESRKLCSIRVRARDEGGAWFETIFQIDVTNVAESSAKALTITGRSVSDRISLAMLNGKLQVTKNGVKALYNPATISSLTVKTLGGSDRVTVGAGVRAVKIYGGDGNDSLTGGENADLLDGGAGTDLLKGGRGNDTINGHSGNDKLYGGAGNDRLIGGTGSDYLYGEADNDELFAIDRTRDYLSGGAGSDKAHLEPARDRRLDTLETLLTQ
jgi:hypothetical protein